MRRMILASLVLTPVLAHAAAIGKVAETPAATTSMNSLGKMALRETVQTQVTNSFVEAALRNPGTLEYSMRSTPTVASAPKVTKAVEVELSEQEMAAQPASSQVVLKAIVDENGIPRNVAVTKSAGAVVDTKALAAVSQYRFKPAMVDNQATWATVSITIQIQKQ